MTSTTSNTTTFNLEVDDIIEQALEPLGGDYTSSGEQSKARRALNLILIELQNKNIPLNKIDTVSVDALDGVLEYSLDGSISDVLEATLKEVDTSQEASMERYGVKEYHALTNKTREGRPTVYLVDRTRTVPILKLWAVPDESSKWTVELLVSKRIEDITASFQQIDLPYRYFPLIVAWLSYKLSMSRQGIDEATKQRLKNELDMIMMDTFDEDRERVDFTIVPGGISGR